MLVTLLLLLAVAPARADWPNTNATKWVQYPITTASGTNAPDFGLCNYAVADDFLCTNSGPVTDIHLWGSWWNDQPDPNAAFFMSIHSDVPVSATNNFSHPGATLWLQVFGPGQYSARPVNTNTEAFLVNNIIWGYTHQLWQFNFYPTNPFVQQGSPQAPVTYWVAVQQVAGSGCFGWKSSTNHWGDAAVAGGAPWGPMPGVDLAFAVTTPSCASATPPTATILSPVSTNVCSLVNVLGSAFDPGGLPVSYTLQYQYLPWNSVPGPLTTFASGSTPVVNGLLGVWDASTLSPGYYHLHLNVNNTCSLSTTGDAYVWVCRRGIGDFIVGSPGAGSVVGGSACIRGTVWDECFCYYTVEYRPAGVGSFTPVDPLLHPTYTTTVLNDLLASWDTTGVPDGNYDLRITACNCWGNCVTNLISPVTVDNTPPTAVITAPQSCTRVSGQVHVFGTVADANWGGWTLEYSGGADHVWHPIKSGSVSVLNGELGVWDTTGLLPCSYALRLVAQDKSELLCDPYITHFTEYLVTVTTQDCPIPPSLGASLSSNAMTISVTGQTNVSYTVEYTPVLPPTSGWTPLSNFLLMNNPQRILDFSISNTPQRFYRARTP